MSLRTRIRTWHRTRSRLYDGMCLMRGIDYRAARPMPHGDLHQRRKGFGTVHYTVRTARFKRASWRCGMRGGNCSLDGGKWACAVRLQRGYGPQKATRVRVAGSLEDIQLAA